MKNLLFSLLLVLSIPSLSSILFAGTENLSTTYPSPNGNYKSLEALYEAIGATPVANEWPLYVTATQPGGFHTVRLEYTGAGYLGLGYKSKFFYHYGINHGIECRRIYSASCS